MSVIRIEQLSKTFFIGFWRKKVEALKGIDLTVESNEIFGFLGPNGAGKTTTIKVLMSLIRSSSGRAYIFDQDVGDVQIKHKIGFLPEQPYFYDYLKGDEFLSFYAQLFGMSGAARSRKVDEVLELVGLSEARDISLRKYSKGMLQRIGLAQALLNDPQLVILDEPMSGLDPLGRRDVRELIFRLKDQGKTVFFSTHILPDVEMICDRVGLINRGKVIFTGQLHEFMETRAHAVDLQFDSLDQDSESALASLFSGEQALRIVRQGKRALVTVPGEDTTDQVIREAQQRGARLVSMSPQRATLEERFLHEIENLEGKER